jgi:hypothetical protein
VHEAKKVGLAGCIVRIYDSARLYGN